MFKKDSLRLCQSGDVETVIYSKYRFSLLNAFRKRAVEIMLPLYDNGLNPFLYGSLARGDVSKGSDIDIVLLQNINPVIVEELFNKYGYIIFKKVIVQATPTYIPKIYLWFDSEGKEVVSLPLGLLKSRELEFYKFGGLLSYVDLAEGKRVLGVDKRLMLIRPVKDGHLGECIIGREGYVASLLNVSEALVKERVSVLSKREKHGRTGVFIEHVVEGDTLEAIKNLSRDNKFFRKMVGLK